MTKTFDSFDLRVKKPIDKRFSTDLLENIELPYEGLISYQKSDKKTYKYKNGSWIGIIADELEAINQSLEESFSKKMDKGSIFINVKDYGATGDSVTDDLGAFNLAIADLPTNGGVLKIPSGRYLLSAPLVIANKDITIEGDGVQLSELFFPSSNGIVYSSTNLFTDCCFIRDLSLITLSDNLYVGISISFPSNVGSPWINAMIERVLLSPSTAIVDYNKSSNNSQTGANNWLKGIYLNNCAVSHIKDTVVRASNWVENDSGIGIHIDGYTVDVLIDHCKTYGTDIGFKKTGSGEGIYIINTEFINVGNGININPDVTTQNGVYATLQNCHCAYFLNGFIVNYHPQVTINNCLFYKYGASSGGCDIMLRSSSTSHITNNKQLVKTGVGTSDGIVITGCQYVVVEGNFIGERVTGIWIQADSSSVRLSNNILVANVTDILDLSASSLSDKLVYPTSSVQTLTGGQTVLNFTIPTGVFVNKPSVAFLTECTQGITGYYDFDNSTNVLAVFNIKRADNTVVLAGGYRMSLLLLE